MPWREQIMSVKVAHVHAVTFAGSGLLVEPVPVAATHTAHKNFSLLFLPKSKGKLHNTGALGFSEPALSTCSLAQIRKMGSAVQIDVTQQSNTLG